MMAVMKALATVNGSVDSSWMKVCVKYRDDILVEEFRLQVFQCDKRVFILEGGGKFFKSERFFFHVFDRLLDNMDRFCLRVHT